jgi:hypothetical protein
MTLHPAAKNAAALARTTAKTAAGELFVLFVILRPPYSTTVKFTVLE